MKIKSQFALLAVVASLMGGSITLRAEGGSTRRTATISPTLHAYYGASTAGDCSNWGMMVAIGRAMELAATFGGNL